MSDGIKFLVVNEGTAARRRVLFSVNSSSTGQPALSQTFSGSELQVSKNGAAFADAANSGTVSERGIGVYQYEYSAGEVDTLGHLTLRLVKTGMISRDFVVQVIALNIYDAVRGGLTALPNANAEAAGGLYTRGSGAGQINQNANGQVDTRTVAMATDVVTAAAIAPAAIGASELAAGAVTAIQSGLATSANQSTILTNIAAIQADTDNIQTRLPAALVSGRMDSSVGAVATDAISDTGISAAAVTKIQNGLATAAAVAGVQADTDAIQTAVAGVQSDTDAIQASLAAGVSVASIAANAISSAATDASFVTEMTAAIDAALSATHGAGNWEGGGGGGGGGATPAQLWAHVIEGSFTAEQLVRMISSVLFGKASNLKSSQPVFRDLADTKNRIVATVSGDGNTRTITSRDGT